MDQNLARWRHAQDSAASPDDWREVDRLAIMAAKKGFYTTDDVLAALHLAICQLGSTDEGNVDGGFASEIWVEHIIKAVWQSLSDIEETRNSCLQLPFPAHSIGRDCKLVAVSQPWCELLGYPASDVLGRRSVDFLTDASRQKAAEVYLPEFWKTGWLNRVEYTMVTASGAELPIFLSAIAKFDSEGSPVSSLAIISPRSL